jgi:hypothetical protein
VGKYDHVAQWNYRYVTKQIQFNGHRFHPLDEETSRASRKHTNHIEKQMFSENEAWTRIQRYKSPKEMPYSSDTALA